MTESELNARRSTKVRLYDAISEIHLHPSLDDDALNYTCEAIHDALPPWKHLKASLQLSVLCKFFCTLYHTEILNNVT